MNTVPPKFHDAIPGAIRPLILECPLLASEDPKIYHGLLIQLWGLLRPKNVLQWLDLKKLVDLIWEGVRLGRIKAEIINSAQKVSLSRLLLSMTNERVCDFTPSGNVTQAEESAVNWFTDPVAKKEIQALFAKFNYSQKTIDAVAFVQHVDKLATLEKMQVSNEARQLAVRRQLEEEQEILQLQSSVTNEDDEKIRQLEAGTANDVGEHNEDKQAKHGQAENNDAREKDVRTARPKKGKRGKENHDPEEDRTGGDEPDEQAEAA